MMNTSKHLLGLAVGLAFLLLASKSAHAYPHYQFSSDTATCSMCHFSPAGGGLINDWGRGESADTLSYSENGDYEPLHGIVGMPDWLAIGGDLRAAFLYKDTGNLSSAEFLVFPMQADLRARVSKGNFNVDATVGLRGQARKTDMVNRGDGTQGGGLSYLVSREHVLSYKGDDSKTTYRLGRYYAPYGLRIADHTSYVRRYLGFNILEETYGLGASMNKSSSEYHLVAHASDPFQFTTKREFGATAMGEWRKEHWLYGASTRITQGENDLRALASFHYKHWFENKKILFMMELDGGFQRFDDGEGTSRLQMASYAGPVWFPMDGMSVSLAYELFDQDLLVKDVERHAVTGWVSFLPRTHYEVMLMGRQEFIGSDDQVLSTLLQLHYYL